MKQIKAVVGYWVLVLCGVVMAGRVLGQGTAFTYQGQLNGSGGPATGRYDLTFTLYTTNVTGVAVAGPVTNSATGVTNGLFTTLVDFGPGVLTGGSNWLEIGVRTNATGSFFILAPRQQLTPTPYALVAGNLTGLTVQENGSGTPNLIGGAANNTVGNGVVGATIGGGATNTIGPNAAYSFLGGGNNNSVFNGVNSFLGGGTGNSMNDSVNGVLVGGVGNQMLYDSQDSVLAGGMGNTVGFHGIASFVGGGEGNAVGSYAEFAFVGGGLSNVVDGIWGTVPGGAYNLAAGEYSFAAGDQAQALHNGTFVWADAEGTAFASTTTNQFNVRANGGVNLVTGSAGVAVTTGAGTVQMASEPDNVVPSIIVTNNNSYSGHLRFRNYLEVQPNLAGTAAGGLDVRNAGGTATILMNGANGNVTANTFTGSGVGLTTLLAPNLLGAVPASSLTSVPAGNLTGTVAASVLGVAGSWTPTLGDGTNNFQLTTQTGYYEKIGNLAYVEIWLQWAQQPANVQEPAALFTTNLLKLSLPFPVASQRAVFTVGYSQDLATAPLSAVASQGDSFVHFQYQIRDWSYFVSFINGVQTYKGTSDLIAPDYSLITTNVAMKDYVFQLGGEVQVTGFYRWQ